eukprot:GHRQ01031885.1.p1 GENE.GHRQ01031885.1~~GHRQ01031885.1.p1  ORF type:complete len:251 (+),score=39.32 GHRQ01031885.1:74-826(+)
MIWWDDASCFCCIDLSTSCTPQRCVCSHTSVSERAQPMDRSHHHDWHDFVRRTASKLCPAVGVIGAGSYGTALAIHCARAGHPTVIWCRSKEVADEINTQHTNSRRLPGHSCPTQLSATTDLEGMVRTSTLLLLAVPSAHIAATAQRCVEHLRLDAVLVCCAKGAWLPADFAACYCCKQQQPQPGSRLPAASSSSSTNAAAGMLAMVRICLHVKAAAHAVGGVRPIVSCTVDHELGCMVCYLTRHNRSSQ